MTHVELSPPHTPQRSKCAPVGKNKKTGDSWWSSACLLITDGHITELLSLTEDVVAAGRPADAVDTDIVRVGAAAGAIDYLILEQVVSARLFHAAVQATTILHADCVKHPKSPPTISRVPLTKIDSF